jgi:hypothetical protein
VNGAAGSVAQVISLPNGGGAIKGLGEKFGPDPHTGTGNLSVPITVPPGRHGLQPDLTLTYSTGNGNGSFGLGWALSVPGVTRLTSQRRSHRRRHSRRVRPVGRRRPRSRARW